MTKVTSLRRLNVKEVFLWYDIIIIVKSQVERTEKSMTIVYIASAFKGNAEDNLAKTRIYCRLAAKEGYLPIAPHLFYPQFLDDNNPEERELGIQLGLHLLALCDEVWCFGKITEGMAREIKEAEDLCIPIIYKES